MNKRTVRCRDIFDVRRFVAYDGRDPVMPVTDGNERESLMVTIIAVRQLKRGAMLQRSIRYLQIQSAFLVLYRILPAAEMHHVPLLARIPVQGSLLDIRAVCRSDAVIAFPTWRTMKRYVPSGMFPPGSTAELPLPGGLVYSSVPNPSWSNVEAWEAFGPPSGLNNCARAAMLGTESPFRLA